MSWERGLVTHIDDEGMSVKVPTGVDCVACPGKSLCTFQGPDDAYKTLRVALIEGCAVGDRVMVHEPGSVLAVVLLVMVALPFALVITGFGVATCCMRFPHAPLVLWLSGIAFWVGGLYVANRWMTHAPRFQTMVRRPDSADAVRRRGKQSEEAL